MTVEIYLAFEKVYHIRAHNASFLDFRKHPKLELSLGLKDRFQGALETF